MTTNRTRRLRTDVLFQNKTKLKVILRDLISPGASLTPEEDSSLHESTSPTPVQRLLRLC
jgi:hypothetical protein